MRDKVFPLRRTGWSNEWIMACLVAVLVVQLLPQLVSHQALQSGQVPQSGQGAGRLVVCLVAVGVGLVVDAAANGLRQHRLMCGVSAAVTALTVCLLVPAAPLWGMVLLVVFGLIAGKHLWGGNGSQSLQSGPCWRWCPVFCCFPQRCRCPNRNGCGRCSVSFCLPFLAVRPFAGLGMLAGLILSLLDRGRIDWRRSGGGWAVALGVCGDHRSRDSHRQAFAGGCGRIGGRPDAIRAGTGVCACRRRLPARAHHPSACDWHIDGQRDDLLFRILHVGHALNVRFGLEADSVSSTWIRRRTGLI